MTGRRKAFHIIIDGTPSKFKVALKGEMGKNYFYGGLVGVGLNARYQAKLWKFIQNTVDVLENSNNNSNPISPPEPPLDDVQPLENKQKSKQEELLGAPSGNKKLREGQDDAISILQKRLAMGEIDQNEYYELLNILQSSQKHDFGKSNAGKISAVSSTVIPSIVISSTSSTFSVILSSTTISSITAVSSTTISSITAVSSTTISSITAVSSDWFVFSSCAKLLIGRIKIEINTTDIISANTEIFSSIKFVIIYKIIT